MTLAIIERSADTSGEDDSYQRASAFLSEWFEASLAVPSLDQAAQEVDAFTSLAARRPLRRRNTYSEGGNINSLVTSLSASIRMHEQHHQDRITMNRSPLSVDELFREESVSTGDIPPLPFRETCKAMRRQSTETTSSVSTPALSSHRRSRASSRPRDSGGDKRPHSDNGCKAKSRSPKAKNQKPRGSCNNDKKKAKPAVTFNDVVEVMQDKILSANEHEQATSSSDKSKGKKSSPQSSSKSKSPRKKSRSKSLTNMGVECKSTTTTPSASKPQQQRPLDRLCELDGPPDFELGDKAPTTKYQIIESDPNKALRNIAQLRVHDFAWILRSSREWTYAIVADFPEQGDDKCIRFVIDKMGNTKTLQKRHWVKCIRLVGSGKNR